MLSRPLTSGDCSWQPHVGMQALQGVASLCATRFTFISLSHSPQPSGPHISPPTPGTPLPSRVPHNCGLSLRNVTTRSHPRAQANGSPAVQSAPRVASSRPAGALPSNTTPPSHATTIHARNPTSRGARPRTRQCHLLLPHHSHAVPNKRATCSDARALRSSLRGDLGLQRRLLAVDGAIELRAAAAVVRVAVKHHVVPAQHHPA